MKKILIAEDNAFMMDIATTKLQGAGYEIIKTADGGSVVSLLKEKKPDLLILDLLLPNQHGLSVLKEIRDTPKICDIPVIIFSNENGPDIEKIAGEYGAAYFFKALTGTGELVQAVDTLLA